MHPSANGNTLGPAAPSWRGSIVVSLGIDQPSYRSDTNGCSPSPAAGCQRHSPLMPSRSRVGVDSRYAFSKVPDRFHAWRQIAPDLRTACHLRRRGADRRSQDKQGVSSGNLTHCFIGAYRTQTQSESVSYCRVPVSSASEIG